MIHSTICLFRVMVARVLAACPAPRHRRERRPSAALTAFVTIAAVVAMWTLKYG